MNLKITALKPTNQKYTNHYISCYAWKPILSMISIANHIYHKESNCLMLSYENIQQMSLDVGEGVSNGKICRILSKKLKELVDFPEKLEEYGVSVGLKDGQFVFSYPIRLCTEYIYKETGGCIYNTEGIKEDELESHMSAKEEEVAEIIEFLDNCGGFFVTS